MVIDRFLKYVSFDTQSDENSQTTPSTKKQLVLARELEKECLELGFDSVEFIDGTVYAILNANTDEKLDAIGLVAHMDTASEISGANVNPRIIKNYDGSTIVLNEEYSMDSKQFPALENVLGDDLIVTDGTTLLGGDDKAGIAIIMSAVEKLIASNKKHGLVAVAFTPDEEIGRGVDCFKLDKFPVDYAFTVDGDRIDGVDYETFNAAQAQITIHGTSIHPGDAKDRMVNASLLAVEFASMLPVDQTPATTENREGFYHLLSMDGACEEAHLSYIIREHDFEKFTAMKKQMEDWVCIMNEKYGNRFEVEISDQYYNMVQYMNGDMRSVNRARCAMESLGIVPVSTPVRGGTDGAMLTEKGLITPNLGTGSYNHHGRFEFADIQHMEKLVEIVSRIIEE